MKFLLFLFLFVVFYCNYVLSVKSKEKSFKSKDESNQVITAQSRSDIISTLSKTYAMIPLSDKNFTKFVSERPRNYHAAVLFTATGPKYGCDVCVTAKNAFYDVANLYSLAYDFNNTEVSNRIAFFVLEVDSSRSTFQDLGLETVPRFYLLPSRKLSDPKESMSKFEIPNQAFLSGTPGIMQAIEDSLGVKIHSMNKPGPIIVILAVISIVMAWFVSHAASDVPKAIFWYQNKSLWTLISLICFSVGVSGSIFCVIRSAPLYGYGRTGIRIFAGMGRDQFFLEGIIVALLTIGCGLAITLVYYVTKIPFPLLRHAGVILSMSIFIILILQIWDAYIEKTRWYQLKETLPPQVWSYLTSSVKKTSTLPKRLLRISEIWLFEYKDWKGFSKKFYQLIIQYIARLLGVEEFLPKTIE